MRAYERARLVSYKIVIHTNIKTNMVRCQDIFYFDKPYILIYLSIKLDIKRKKVYPFYMKKQVFISGVSGDLGVSLLENFIKNDYFVIGQYCSNYEKIKELSSIYSNQQVEFFQCDFSDVNLTEKFAKNISLRYPNIEVMVNNAGVSQFGLLSDTSTEDMLKIFNINLFSHIILTREISKNMVFNKKGNIINISSIWGNQGASCEAIYSSTKGGLEIFGKALSKELGLSNIRVNNISCGFIQTKMNDRLSETEIKDFCENLSLNRTCSPQEISSVALFLASNSSSYITGQTISVDGGF